MRRWVGIGLGGLAAGALVVWTYQSFRTDVPLESEQELVQATRALMDETWTRPVHVRTPTDDSLADERADLDAIDAAVRPLRHLAEAEKKRVAGVLSGTLPLSQLPDSWSRQLDALRDPLARVLRATHGASQSLPEGLRFIDAVAMSHYSGTEVQAVDDLATLAGWQKLASGQVAVAAAHCVDILALGRDVSHPHMLGQMVGGMAMPHLVPFCTAVINRADARSLDELEWSLKQIEAGWTPLSVTLHNESVYGQLVGYWDALSPGTRNAMPADARAAVESDPSFNPRRGAVRSALIGRWSRREAVRALDLLIGAASQPVDVQDAAFLAHPAHFRVSRWAWSEHASDWLRLGRRFRTLAAQRLLLRAGAATRSRRLHEGRWPTQLPADWVDPRTGLQLDLRPAPTTDGLQLVAVASSRHDAPELVISLLP